MVKEVYLLCYRRLFTDVTPAKAGVGLNKRDAWGW
jgi:hypothetical protein